MFLINLTSEKTGKTLTFGINGNFAFSDNLFQDGNNNNGGWKVKESREEILAKIQLAAKNNRFYDANVSSLS